MQVGAGCLTQRRWNVKYCWHSATRRQCADSMKKISKDTQLQHTISSLALTHIVRSDTVSEQAHNSNQAHGMVAQHKHSKLTLSTSHSIPMRDIIVNNSKMVKLRYFKPTQQRPRPNTRIPSISELNCVTQSCIASFPVMRCDNHSNVCKSINWIHQVHWSNPQRGWHTNRVCYNIQSSGTLLRYIHYTDQLHGMVRGQMVSSAYVLACRQLQTCPAASPECLCCSQIERLGWHTYGFSRCNSVSSWTLPRQRRAPTRLLFQS